MIGCSISDAGLVYLRGLTNLKSWALQYTQVTFQGIADREAALTNCSIQSSVNTKEKYNANAAQPADEKRAEIGGKILYLLFLYMLAAGWPQRLPAETTYVYTHFYGWTGEHGSGDGSMDEWENWSPGNVSITGDGVNPPVVMVLPPLDGDALTIERHDGLHTVSGASLTLPHSPLDIQFGGALNGGSFDVGLIGVSNATDENTGEPLPLTLSGTTLQAESQFGISVTAGFGAGKINLNSVTLRAQSIDLLGGTLFAGPDDPLAEITFSNSLVIATASGDGRLKFVTGAGHWKLNLNADTVLLADMLDIGTAPSEGRLELNGDGTGFILSPLTRIAVDPQSIVRLDVHSKTPAFSPTSNVDIGEFGKAYVTIDNQGSMDTSTTKVGVSDGSLGQINLDHASWTTKDVFLGNLGTATVMADHDSTFASANVVLGAEQSPNVSMVTLDHASKWNISGNLVVGDKGSGQLNVKNGSIVDAMQDIVLGKMHGSHGIIKLVGPAAKLQLAESAKLTIGSEGQGELNLSEGGKYTSSGPTILGSVDGGTGIVTIDGENSLWTVNGDLYIGDHGTGRVEIKNGGKLSATGNSIRLGSQEGGDGTLLLDGATSTLDFTGELAPGHFRKGAVQVHGGASFTTQDMTLGSLEGSEGKLEVINTNSTFKTTGNLTVGEEGRGEINVSVFGKLMTGGNAVFGAEASSGSADNANAALVSGQGSEWTIAGDLTAGKRGAAVITVDDSAKLKVTGNATLAAEATQRLKSTYRETRLLCSTSVEA